MLTVYAAHSLPFDGKGLVRDFRVIWALEELGLPYTFHWMNAGKGEHKVDPHRSINPFGKIPSLTDGELKLFESGAIIHYLYEKAGKLPSDPVAKTVMLQWMFLALNTMEMSLIEMLRWDVFWKDRPGRELQMPELIEATKTRLADLDRTLGSKPYLLGDTFSPADILMTTVLGFGRNQPIVFQDVPRVRAYLERCKARPAYKAAWAKHLSGPNAKAA
jgi:glutathione S-transferase